MSPKVFDALRCLPIAIACTAARAFQDLLRANQVNFKLNPSNFFMVTVQKSVGYHMHSQQKPESDIAARKLGAGIIKRRIRVRCCPDHLAELSSVFSITTIM